MRLQGTYEQDDHTLMVLVDRTFLAWRAPGA